MNQPLSPPPPTLAATREAVHRLSVYVVSPWRRERTGRIGLRRTPGGFGTPVTGDAHERVQITPRGLLVERGEERELAAFSTLAAAARALGVAPDLDTPQAHDVPAAGDPDAPLDIDPAAVAFLAAWYAMGDDLLQALRAQAGPGEEPSEVQLWPEHLDIATEIGTGDARAGYGFSPGDAAHPLPYVYALPWTPPAEGDPFWDEPHFRGRSLGYAQLQAAPDAAAAAHEFLAESRARVSGAAA